MSKSPAVVIGVLLALGGHTLPAEAAGSLKGFFRKVRPRITFKEIEAASKFHRLRWGATGSKSSSASVKYAPLLRKHYRNLRRPDWPWTFNVSKFILRAYAAWGGYLLATGGLEGTTAEKVVAAIFVGATIAAAELARQSTDADLDQARIDALELTMRTMPRGVDGYQDADRGYVSQLEQLKDEISALQP